MKKLHLVGLATDQRSLIFSTRRGSKSGSFSVAVDPQFIQALRALEVLHLGDEPGVSTKPAIPSGAPGAEESLERQLGRTRQNSSLSVREVQSRLRRGQSLDAVAVEAGVTPEWIARFAVPVMAEQASVIEELQRSTYVAPRKGRSGARIAVAVSRNLSEKGVHDVGAILEHNWSATHVDGDEWVVRLSYRARARDQQAEWRLHRHASHVHAANRLGADLAYVPPTEVAVEAAMTPRPTRVPTRSAPQPTRPTPSKTVKPVMPTAKRATNVAKRANKPVKATKAKATPATTKAAKPTAKAAKRPTTGTKPKAAKRATKGTTAKAAKRATKRPKARAAKRATKRPKARAAKPTAKAAKRVTNAEAAESTSAQVVADPTSNGAKEPAAEAAMPPRTMEAVAEPSSIAAGRRPADAGEGSVAAPTPPAPQRANGPAPNGARPPRPQQRPPRRSPPPRPHGDPFDELDLGFDVPPINVPPRRRAKRSEDSAPKSTAAAPEPEPAPPRLVRGTWPPAPAERADPSLAADQPGDASVEKPAQPTRKFRRRRAKPLRADS